ncbi:Hsp70 family protein [Rhodococcus sp. NPDC049939]|uniref:Hsp70 family protein n=1 Tax=Rhodococcus sp. NPDC049939 TaxID=3155511 RepID=UPI0033CDBD65
MSTPEWLLGIDFGTSNTAAAHTGAVSGSVEALPLTHQGNLMPSAVFVESPDSITVGDVAINQAERNPAAFLPSPKRVIRQGMVTVNSYDLPASVPVAAVLQNVMGRAIGAHGGQPPAQLVLTHPEAWSPREIQVLVDAAGTLGLDPANVQTVSEPRAAAHYYTRTNTLAPGAKIAVFDFGGGTLDVAVLAANDEGSFDVLAARGDNGLGGKNFDAFLRRWVDEQLEGRNPELLTYLRQSAPVGVRHNLDDSIRRAKELLSESPSATITVAGGGFHETFQITRDEFEELISAPLDKAVNLTRATLADAQITDPSQLEALYLTGGSSRIPLVHERLKPLGPIATLDDPKTVVAQGALAAAAPVLRGLPAQNAPAHPQSPVAAYGGPNVQAPPQYGQPAAYGQIPGPAFGQPPQFGGPGQGAPTQNPVPRAHPVTSHPGGPATEWPAPPAAPDSTPSAAKGKSKWVIAGSAAVALVAIVTIASTVLLTGGSNDTADAGTDGISNSAQQADDAQGLSGDDTPSVALTQEQVLATLPAPLSRDLEDCKKIGFTDNDGLQIQCTIKKGSNLTTGVTDGVFDSIIVSVDKAAAKKTVLAIRQGFQKNTAVAENVIVENTARTAAAHISGPYSPDYSIYYANNANGVKASFSGATSVETARVFLSRAGLLN